MEDGGSTVESEKVNDQVLLREFVHAGRGGGRREGAEGTGR